MRTLAITGMLTVVLFAGAAANAAEPACGVMPFRETGLQLYSLRDQFAKDGVGPTLDLVKSWGIKYVELAGTYGLEPAKFKAELDQRGLIPISAHFPFKQYEKAPEAVAQEAKALGLKYAGCAWIGHKPPFDEAQCLKAAEIFNRAGEVLAQHGIKLFIHNHGFEFYPHGSGTLFDLLVEKTRPEYVSFQIDVLWAVLPGQDPAKLLLKYPTRFELVHLKDLKKGVPTGDMSAKTDKTNDVALGTGQVDWPAFVAAAAKSNVKYCFIEDESPTSVEQIPQSLKFIRGVQ